ncbi:MAG: polysaccharide pyruvyl transferase family protein [Planctomycetes bacterium]|nr:polysaccharide pyruvyl transferase family protein [Planctomycetota bacterium]
MDGPGERLRIGVSGSYGGLNMGDEAILHALLAQVRGSLTAELTVYTRDSADTLRRHQVERAVAIRDLSRDEARQEVARLDVLLLGGGGILFDGEAEHFLREVQLAHELGVPVVVYAVSVGPLAGPQLRDAVRDALDHAAVVTVRDRQSKRLLEEIGVRADVELTADPALLLEPEALPDDTAAELQALDRERCLVAFSVREPGPAAPDLDVEHYHALLANAADFVADRLDAQVVFVPMERRNEDLQQSHAVVARMRMAERAHVLRRDYTPGQLLTLIGRTGFAVGMRLHFLIFALLQGVPFVALPYASKVRGLVEELQLPAPPLEQTSVGRLLATIDRTWDHREALRARLGAGREELRARARRTHARLLELVARRRGFERPTDLLAPQDPARVEQG